MTLQADAKPVEILLVEDNPADVELTQRILGESKFPRNINLAEDGEAAMAYLRKEGGHVNAPRPDLILLDLAMPKKTGYEVLEEMDADPDLRKIPVMILTSTQAERDRLHYENVGPHRFCTKPLPLERFDTIIHQLKALADLDPGPFGTAPPWPRLT